MTEYERPMRRVWDSSSLGPLMECPEKYRLSILEGWAPADIRIDLEFGRVAGEALERYFLDKCAGLPHDVALVNALKLCLDRTWDKNGPTLGSYLHVWRCRGMTKYKNDKGNAAKCPFSHAGKWFPEPAPSMCGRCGSPTQLEERWYPINPVKDRLALLRLVIAYCDDVDQGALQPALRADGSPLLEHHWRIPFTDRVDLAGNLDKVVKFGEAEEVYITDYKTTKNSIGSMYWAAYWPNLQVGVYDMTSAASLPPHLAPHYRGIMIEAIQLQTEGVKIARQIFAPTPAERDEVARDIKHYLDMAAYYHETGYWPRNRTACYLCQFKAVCGAPPHMRQSVLETNFVQGWWNPTTRNREAAPPENATGGLDKTADATHLPNNG